MPALVFSYGPSNPSLYPTRNIPTQFWHRCMEWGIDSVSTKPFNSSRNLWLRWDLNPGLPTGVLSTTPRSWWTVFTSVRTWLDESWLWFLQV
jgi:hypothetical protein